MYMYLLLVCFLGKHWLRCKNFLVINKSSVTLNLFLDKNTNARRIPWTARRSNQSTLKEISPEYSLERKKMKSLSHVQLFETPWTVAHQAPHPWDFPGKNTGVGCHFLLQEIFPTQGLNLGLPHCRSRQGTP